jgi:hypothetical protein
MSPPPPPDTPPSPSLSVPSPPVEIHRPQSPSNTHTMVTRAKHGLFKPTARLNLSVTTSTPSPIPKTYRGALHDPHWRRAMQDEFDALVTNGTWTLVPRPARANVVSGKWIYSNTSSTPTAALHGIRQDGWSVASHNSMGWTSTRPLVPL